MSTSSHTYSLRVRKRSKMNDGSQPRSASTSSEPDTDPEDLLPAYTKSSSGRPPKGTLGPQPTLQNNIQPLQHISDDARQRAEDASLIGARCALTQAAATKGDDIHDKTKVQLMHVVKRSSDELLIRRLEYILGLDPGSFCVDSSSNLFYGIRALHEPFDATTDSWGLCPPRSLLLRVRNLYNDMQKRYDRGAILQFWEQVAAENEGRYRFGLLPFGNFNGPITRQLLDDKHEPTGQTVTFNAPYATLIVESHLRPQYVLWNLLQKVATQSPSVLCTAQQCVVVSFLKNIDQLFSSLKLPPTFYNPPLPLLQQPAFTPGTESDEEKTVYSLRTRKVTTQGDDIDEPPQENDQPSTGAGSTAESTAGQKRKSRHAGSTTSNATPTSSQPAPEPRPRKSRPGRSAPSQAGKD